MKKILLAVTFLFCLSIAFGQYIDEGRFLGGGRGSLKFRSWEYIPDEKARETSFKLSPNLGYFFMDKWAAGINLDFQSSKINYPGSVPDNEYNEIGAGIFTRYYLCDQKRKRNFFLEGGYNIGGSKQNDNDRINYNSFFLGIAFACFFSDCVAFEMGFDYCSLKYEDDDSRINSFGLNLGFQKFFNFRKPPVVASVSTY